MADQEVGNLAVRVSMDSTGFQNGISNLNTQLRVVQSSFRAASAELGGFSGSTDQLRLRADSLNQQIDLQRQRVETLTTAYQRSVEANGADATATQNLEIRLNSARAALANMENELTTTNNRIAVQSSSWTSLGTTLNSIGSRMSDVGKSMADVGKKLSTTVTAPIIGIGTVAAKSAMDFEDGMAKISTVADTSKTSLKSLGDGIINLSDQTGQATTDIQEGLYDAISSGVDTAKSMDFMTVAVKAAKGGFTDTKTSVDGLTTTLNAYGLQADKATVISNEMMVAQNLGKTTFGEMAQSIGNVVPTAASLGVTTKELFSSLATLTANGIGTSEAVTGLKSAFSNIIKPQGQAADLAEKLGINFSAAHLKAVGWGQFLGEIKQKTGGNTQEMAQLFGSVEALNSVLTLTSNQGTSLFNDAMKQMSSGTNYVDDAFNKVTNTSGQKFKNSLNDLKNAGIKLGESLTPIIEKISGVFKTLANALNSMTPAQQQMLIMFAGIAAAVGPVLVGIGSVVSAIGTIASAFGAASTAIGAAGGIIEVITGPIGIAIGAIALLAGAAFLVIKNWGPISGFFKNLWAGVVNATSTAWNGIKTFFDGLWGWIKGFFAQWGTVVLATIVPFIGIPLLIVQHWGQIKAGLADIWDGIKSAAGTAWNAIKDAVMGIIQPWLQGVLNLWDGMKTGLTTIMEGYKNYLTGIWNVIKNIFLGAVLLIIDLVTGNFDKLKSDAEGIFNNLKAAFGQIWTGIKQIFTGSLQAISGFLTTEWNGIKNTAETVWNGVKSFFSGLWDGIKSTASTAWNGFKSWLSGFWDGIVQGAKDIWNGLLNWFRTLPENLHTIAVNMFNSMKNGVESTVTGVVGSVKSGINGAITWIKGLPSQALQWGKDMIQGLINGIKSMVSSIGNAVSNVADTIRSFLHFSTPDQGPLADYESWMPDFMAGMAKGIDKSKSVLKSSINGLAADMSLGVKQSISVTPQDVSGASTASSQGNGQSISFADMFRGAIFNVRDQNDIYQLSTELSQQTAYRLQAAGAGRGR